MSDGSERGTRHRSRRPPVAGSRAADAADAEALAAAGSVSNGSTVGLKPAEPGPANARWRALLDEGGPILADGAMGTMLFASGLQFGDPPEVWNVSQPEVVRRIQRGYLEAGSRIVMTNTFGGNRLRLRLHGLHERVGELNRTAAILLRKEVDAAGGRALVAGDIGPTGEIMAPLGTLSDEEATEVFAEQAAALIAGGVDVIWIETMSHLSEIRAAVQGVRQVSADIPIIATMTFDTRGHTMMGVSPEQAVTSLASWGVDAIGGNCGNGPDELLPVIERMRAAAPDVTLVAKSNAGMPELVDMRAVYRADPPTMAEAGLAFHAAGARIIGACCGSTPAHLKAMADALSVSR
jgi:5-methyltetrahydrofolate--homocysteine methyltransferase